MDGMTQVKEDPVATASGNGKMPDDVQRGETGFSRSDRQPADRSTSLAGRLINPGKTFPGATT